MSANRQKSYTVKQVAELSRVSVRALHFYDEIGLLRPAFVGENGYRYYQKEQLLRLQQILFYRELGFELAQIEKVMASSEFDQATALRSHRDQLVKESARTAELIRTIDKTLAQIERGTPMKDDELYTGFDAKKLAEFEEWGREKFGDAATARWKAAVEESKEKTKNWKKADFEKVGQTYEELHQAFAEALKVGTKVDEAGVQDLVRRHFQVVSLFWQPNRKSYIGLGKTYCEHPDFRKVYDRFHPRLAEYLAEAMTYYAKKELPDEP